MSSRIETEDGQRRRGCEFLIQRNIFNALTFADGGKTEMTNDATEIECARFNTRNAEYRFGGRLARVDFLFVDLRNKKESRSEEERKTNEG